MIKQDGQIHRSWDEILISLNGQVGTSKNSDLGIHTHGSIRVGAGGAAARPINRGTQVLEGSCQRCWAWGSQAWGGKT